MAYRTKSNLVSSRDEYSRYYPAFSGVDFTSDPADVAPTRFAYAKNMWRDYGSEHGGAVETIPGYRLLHCFDGKINGIHQWSTRDGLLMIALHAGTELYVFPHSERDSIAGIDPVGTLADHRSAAFVYQSALYILDGEGYYKLTEGEGGYAFATVSDSGYIPISYSDGLPYEQRNMLSDKFINRYNLLNLEDYLVDAEEQGYTCEFNEDTHEATITGQPKPDYDGSLYIPKTIYHGGDAYTVTAIAPGAFSHDGGNYYDVYIPSTVKSIGTGAFIGVNEVTFEDPENSMLEYIGAQAFEGCSARYVVIPRGVKLGRGAFANNPGYSDMIVFLCRGVTLEGTDSGVSPFYDSRPILIYENGLERDEALWRELESQAYGIEYNATLEAIEYGGKEIGDITPPALEYGSERYSRGEIYYYRGKISVAGAGLLVWGAGDFGSTVYYSYNKYADTSETLYEYRFTIFDKALAIDKVMIDQTDMGEISFYGAQTAPVEKGGLVIELSVKTKHPDTLEGRVLTIHGTAEASRFTTVEGYVDALSGNSDYTGTALEAICECTLCEVYDGRIFLSGNPALPNTVFYSQRDLTGFNNPAYFGVLNFFNDGASNVPIKALMTTASQLCVLKGDTVSEGSIYYHSGADGGNDLVPRVYPSTQGLAGLGCVGAATNFYDDPVFLSKRGLEAIGKQQVNLERTLEHRSYNVDTRLCAEDLSQARLAEWQGYLVIMCGGHLYLADSRQLFTHKTGVVNYEWYYLEDIGQHRGQVERFFTITEDSFFDVGGEIVPLTELSIYAGGEHHPLKLDTERRYVDAGAQICEEPWYMGDQLIGRSVYYVIEDGEYILCDTVGEMTGGEYFEPCAVASVDDVLYFGCDGGGLYCFNTDKRGQSVIANGEDIYVEPDRIHESFYTFDGRRYLSGCSTKADNCDIPHLTKQTRRGSFIVRVKTFAGVTMKAKGRIERGDLAEWRELPTQSASRFDLTGLSFGSFSTAQRGTQLCMVREAYRRWYEKQIYFYSDEYRAPFGIYSAAYRYCVQGRIRI